jgi:outer membrane immunogenic protein
MAAEMAVKAAPIAAAPAFSWTGCYIGVEGGYAWGRSKHQGTFAPGFGTVGDFTPFFNVTGGLAGGEFGCNAQIGNSIWVMGAESDISWTSKKGSSAEGGLGAVLVGSTLWQDETREKWISTSRVRIGPSWGPLWGYITGGFASARVEARVTNAIGLQFSDQHTLFGWTAGVGVEYAWFNNWSVKVEYLYARFENRSFFDIPPSITALPGCGGAFGVAAPCTRGSLNLDDHIVRVGLNWRFGGFGGYGGPGYRGPGY